MSTRLSKTESSKGTALEIHGPHVEEQTRVLTPEALQFLGRLIRRFAPRVDELLSARRQTHARFARGERPDFLPGTRLIRESPWTVAPLPRDLEDRRVEITGPVDKKMIINAMNSGANVFMADFEDATAPTWSNLVSGQSNLVDAVRGDIEWVAEGGKKVYRLGDRPAVLFVRPRGLHLEERHVTLGGKPVPGALFDFGVFVFHNAKPLAERGSGAYFYIPKLESHLEARLWNEVFSFAEEELGLTPSSIKATVLIETLPAAFEMHEILYELREHSAGLNCGRWDYMFSFIKTMAEDPGAVLPERGQLTMDKGFLFPYTQLLIKTCHQREVHAMGGMAAQIPIKDDPAKNELALSKVRADKLREVSSGHDGTWVAHPGLVPIAKAIFDEHMPAANQIAKKRDDVLVSRADLLTVPQGTRTEAGLSHNIRVGIRYIEAWLRGTGCVPIDNLMEDAATAEICRTQVWQWIHHHARLDDGTEITRERVRELIDREMKNLIVLDETWRCWKKARALFETLSTQNELEQFLTIPAYELLLSFDQK